MFVKILNIIQQIDERNETQMNTLQLIQNSVTTISMRLIQNII